jgi:glycosyltransferase involved in cell wall biosynthesis
VIRTSSNLRQRIRVAILQNECPEYRWALYSGLAEDFEVTIVHAGTPTNRVLGCAESYVPAHQLGRLYLQWGVRDVLRRGNFDVVVVMFDLAWPSYMSYLLLPHRPRVLLWGHRYGPRPLANLIRDLFMRRADAQIMYSREDFPELVSRGADMSKIYVADNTVHVANYRDCSSDPKSSFLFVGRLQPRKRVDLLIRAFADLPIGLRRRLHVDIIGDGSEGAALRELATELDLGDGVRFHGSISDEVCLEGFFSAALAYVSPGPVGLGVLHAFAYGVPVVTMRVGRHGPEFTNLEHMRNSIICSDEATIGAALSRLASDLEFAKRLGSEAYRHYVDSRQMTQMVAAFRCALLGGSSDGSVGHEK